MKFEEKKEAHRTQCSLGNLAPLLWHDITLVEIKVHGTIKLLNPKVFADSKVTKQTG